MIAELCLSLALYHEARGEPLNGQRAVAEVIMNRVESDRFPDTICGVVMQPNQFSFVSPNGWAGFQQTVTCGLMQKCSLRMPYSITSLVRNIGVDIITTTMPLAFRLFGLKRCILQ